MKEDILIRRIEETVRKGLGGLGLSDFINRLKDEKGINDKVVLKGKGRSNSFVDLNRNNEEDDRRVNTDPLDHKNKHKYDNRPNPFLRNPDDPEHPNNCYAECSRRPKRIVNPENSKTKVI